MTKMMNYNLLLTCTQLQKGRNHIENYCNLFEVMVYFKIYIID